EVHQPKPIPKEEPRKETKPSIVKRGVIRIEKMVISTFWFAFIGLLIASISLEMQVSTTSREVQDISSQVAQTETVNSNLEQNVQELSRYDRVYSIAEERGLELNEENIKNVKP
ncbi:cell division protein FtsL, partial [Salmonella enterica]|uniref:cell division protein FtsL n=1 Tax=Salmonella enterica TaxID=28901 RepID=UPI000C227336